MSGLRQRIDARERSAADETLPLGIRTSIADLPLSVGLSLGRPAGCLKTSLFTTGVGHRTIRPPSPRPREKAPSQRQPLREEPRLAIRLTDPARRRRSG